MWATYYKYYDCEKAYFMSRIAQHDYFILFLINEEIVGFPGIKKDVIKKGTINNTVVGLAMTVIDKKYRNKALTQRAVCKLYQREFIQNSFRNIFVWSVAAT
jgi:predicted acetyltransferase